MFNQYPYLNINDLNLDFILKAIREMKYEVTNFVSINAIKYADPIQWNITSQYEKNTIVIDPLTGTAYISVAPVPAGVALTRPEFWTVVFDLGSFVTRAAQNFTSRWESDTTTTATFATTTGSWLVWGDVLYKALTNITAGDTYVVGSNIEHFTIEDLYNAYLNTIANILALVGDLADLNTSDKTSIVNAINSVINDYTNAINGVINDYTNADNNINVRIDNVIAFNNKKQLFEQRYIKTSTFNTLFGVNEPAQAFEYNPVNNSWWVSKSESSTNPAQIIELSKDFTTVLNRASGDYGHINDMTYNPYTEKIYGAGGASGSDIGKILIINRSTLALEGTVPTINLRRVYCIAYDPISRRYAAVDYDYLIHIYNDNFDEISVGTTRIDQWLHGDGYTVPQTITYYNGMLLCYCSYVKYDNDGNYYVGRAIASIDVNGDIIANTFLDGQPLLEGEGITSADGLVYIMDNSEPFVLFSECTPTNVQGMGVFADRISQNADLNNITTLGVHYAPSAAWTSTYTNKPSDLVAGFKMEVFIQYGLLVQEITDTGGDKWRRRYSGSTWFAWTNSIGNLQNSISTLQNRVIDLETFKNDVYIASGYLSNESYTIELPANRSFMIISDTGITQVNSFSTSLSSFHSLVEDSNLSFTASGRNVTITATGTVYLSIIGLTQNNVHLT